MASIPNQNLLSSALLTAVIVGSGIATISVLPIFIYGIRIYLLDRTKKDYYANSFLKSGEWTNAKARATGEADNAIAFFTSIFERPQVTGATTRPRCSRCDAVGSSTSSDAPPPYTPRARTDNSSRATRCL
jgi:hypothetical protein